jgi:two-component system, sensor histidine kinase
MKRLRLPGYDGPALLAAQMELIDRSSGPAMLGCFLASAFLALGLPHPDSSLPIWPWSLGMGVLCALGHWGRRLLPERCTPAGAPRYARAMNLQLGALGLLWGAGGCLYMDLASLPTALSLLTVIAGMCAAALSVFSPCLPVAVSYLSGAVLPVWMSFLIRTDSAYLALQLGIPLFLVVLLLFAHNHYRVIRHSIELRFENLDLVERLQEQRQRAEEAGRAKMVFLASASHDLRQPLHALNLFTVTLRRTALSGRQSELLGHIEASAGAAREMLNALLDFSKLEAGVVKPHPVAVRLQTLFRRLEDEFAPQADDKGLIYRTRDTPILVQTDPQLLELILRNFISNAIRYTETGGLLIDTRWRGNRAVVEVWDTGIGIPASQHKAIFREFHQLGNPERDRRKGLGLGLAIVDGLAQALGVKIEVASRPGRGSVFRVWLPLAREAPPHTAHATPGHTSPIRAQLLPPGLRVLVIDDDPAILLAMGELLRGWQLNCVCCETEEEALAQVAHQAPALVIADYRLRSHRTGQQALDAIHQQLGRMLPAIILTGDTAPDRLREALASSAVLMHKPVDVEQLYATMLQLLTPAAAPAPPSLATPA